MAVAGALILAGCQNIFDTPVSQESGYGRVSVNVGVGSERTIFPASNADGTFDANAFGTIVYEFKKDGAVVNHIEVDNGIFVLPVGSYTVTVYAGTDDDNDDEIDEDGLIAQGSAPVTVLANALVEVKVKLTPVDNDGDGTFEFTFDASDLTTPSVIITVEKWNGTTFVAYVPDEDVGDKITPNDDGNGVFTCRQRRRFRLDNARGFLHIYGASLRYC